MIDLPSDIDDRDAYPLVPQSDRWIFNKLILAERLGYNCGPSGTFINTPGLYCIRPIMGSQGRGRDGGFFKFEVKLRDNILVQPPYRSGYFWCEWFDGRHAWTDFTNDVVVFESGGPEVDGVLHIKYGLPPRFTELPLFLQNMSKHMLVEHIGDKIIEVAPRHAERIFPLSLTRVRQQELGSDFLANLWAWDE